MRPPESLQECRRANSVIPARECSGSTDEVYEQFTLAADPRDQVAKVAPYVGLQQQRQPLPAYGDGYHSSPATYSGSTILNAAFSDAGGCIGGAWPVEAQGAGGCDIGVQAGTTSWIYFSGLNAHSKRNSATYVGGTAVAANWSNFQSQMQSKVAYQHSRGTEMSASLAAVVSPAIAEAPGLNRLCAGSIGFPGTDSSANETNIFPWRTNCITPLVIKAPTSGMGAYAGDRKTRTKEKYRVVYTDQQRSELENAFQSSRYVTARMKAEMAQLLNLSERQIKIWFQNRRAKERKQSKRQPSITATGTPVPAPDAREIGTTNEYFMDETGDEIFSTL